MARCSVLARVTPGALLCPITEADITTTRTVKRITIDSRNLVSIWFLACSRRRPGSRWWRRRVRSFLYLVDRAARARGELQRLCRRQRLPTHAAAGQGGEIILFEIGVGEQVAAPIEAAWFSARLRPSC